MDKNKFNSEPAGTITVCTQKRKVDKMVIHDLIVQ